MCDTSKAYREFVEEDMRDKGDENIHAKQSEKKRRYNIGDKTTLGIIDAYTNQDPIVYAIRGKWYPEEDIKLLFEPDSIVKTIIKRFETRAEHGFKKYGHTLDRTDISVVEWVQHIQDELHDAILYLEKLKQVLNGK